ncbi:hypothetical protein KI387_006274, partial [Taxus chinensis]
MRAAMGRNKIEIKRIENDTRRQVTFFKRRNGLFKKAGELAILTCVRIAIIIFTSTGKLFQYSSENMSNILASYNKCPTQSSCDRGGDDDLQELAMLRNEIAQLQLKLRRMMGEQLSDLQGKELVELEHNVRVALSRIKAKKNDYFLQRIDCIGKMEPYTREENRMLRSQLLEIAEPAKLAIEESHESMNSEIQMPASKNSLDSAQT